MMILVAPFVVWFKTKEEEEGEFDLIHCLFCCMIVICIFKHIFKYITAMRNAFQIDERKINEKNYLLIDVCIPKTAPNFPFDFAIRNGRTNTMRNKWTRKSFECQSKAIALRVKW